MPQRTVEDGSRPHCIPLTNKPVQRRSPRPRAQSRCVPVAQGAPSGHLDTHLQAPAWAGRSGQGSTGRALKGQQSWLQSLAQRTPRAAQSPGWASTEPLPSPRPQDLCTHSAESTSGRPSGGTGERTRSPRPPPVAQPSRRARALEHRGSPAPSTLMLGGPGASTASTPDGPHPGLCSPHGAQKPSGLAGPGPPPRGN